MDMCAIQNFLFHFFTVMCLQQVELTVDRGLAETQDVEMRGVLFQQLMGLADLLLDSYSSQLIIFIISVYY
jgi:hypothetical protein